MADAKGLFRQNQRSMIKWLGLLPPALPAVKIGNTAEYLDVEGVDIHAAPCRLGDVERTQIEFFGLLRLRLVLVSAGQGVKHIGDVRVLWAESGF